MSCQQFISNLEGLNNGKDFPKELLKVHPILLQHYLNIPTHFFPLILCLCRFCITPSRMKSWNGLCECTKGEKASF